MHLYSAVIAFNMVIFMRSYHGFMSVIYLFIHENDFTLKSVLNIFFYI